GARAHCHIRASPRGTAPSAGAEMSASRWADASDATRNTATVARNRRMTTGKWSVIHEALKVGDRARWRNRSAQREKRPARIEDAAHAPVLRNRVDETHLTAEARRAAHRGIVVID